MSFDPEKITFFAKTDARGQQIPFGIKAKDRQRHMYVVGKTGMGKSTLLENMAAQDIQNGEGMAFIDPHGPAAQTLLDYIPEHRIDDVVYFAPFDMSSPVSFNVMEDVGPDKRHLVVSGLMSTFKKIWVDAWSARMEYILTNALLALIEYPDTTLLSVNRLFSDKAYRARVVDYIKDPAVKAFWTEEFANYTDRFTADALPAIQNKIGQFTGNPLIRNIIGQPHSSFDIRKIMDEKKILIMNLSKGLVGETNANLLGSMLTTRIYLAAMSRADLPVEQMRNMPNFYFYVDEFQSFANSTFANILSEARKYHLNLIIAHQYIEQMEEDVRNAVFGNVGTTIAFRVGPFDAEVLETVFSPRFVANDLVNLGFAQIYLTLMIDGIGSQPFSAITLPPVEKPRVSCKDMVVSASRKNFAKSREEVEKIIADLHTPTKTEAPVKKNNNTFEYKPKKEVEDKKIIQTPEMVSGRTTVSVPDKPKVLVSNDKNSNGSLTNERKAEVKENPIKNVQLTDKKPQRSLSDLRSILGKLSQSSQLEKKASIVENKNVAEVRLKEKETIKTEIVVEAKTHSSELQSVLASLIKKTEEVSHTPDNVPEKKEVLMNKNSDTNVKNIFKPKSVDVNEDNNFKAKDETRMEMEKMSAEVEAFFTGLEKTGSESKPIQIIHKEKRPINNFKNNHNKNHHHRSIDHKLQNKSTTNNNSNEESPLSPKKIEKRLRQPNNERSPFAS
jgi:hypothetical protein